MSNRKNWFFVLNAVVGILLIYLLHSSFDLRVLIESFTSVSLLVFFGACVLYFLANLVGGALRLHYFLPEVSFRKFVFIHQASMFLSDLTPGRVGYSYLVFALRKLGVKASRAAKFMAISLFSDFFVRSLFLFAAVFVFATDFSLIGLILLAGSLAFLGVFFWRVELFSRLAGCIPFVGKKIQVFYNDFFTYKIKKSALLYSVVLSLIAALPRAGAWWLLLNAVVGVQLDFISVLVLMAVITAVSFIPLSIAGLGVQEGAGAFLLNSLLLIPLPQAISGLLLIRFTELFVDSLFGTWHFLLKRGG
ncbi:MAG: lysylphosphatidylglycerol synthase domain-containing protein [Candidatus Micrarchaeota archaeon]